MSSDDDKVGYGKPPKHSQFRKGTSGNPKGRPKGAKNLATIIMDEAFAPQKITMNGKTKTLPKLAVGIAQLMNKAATGDNKATLAAVQLVSQVKPIDSLDGQDLSLTPDQEASLKEYLAMHSWMAGKGPKPSHEA